MAANSLPRIQTVAGDTVTYGTWQPLLPSFNSPFNEGLPAVSGPCCDSGELPWDELALFEPYVCDKAKSFSKPFHLVVWDSSYLRINANSE